MKTKIRALMAAAVAVLGGLVLALTAVTASAAPAPPVTCAYYTTNSGLQAVALTTGVNCDPHHHFTIKAAPYHGATFANYATFLEQYGEFVNGPLVLTPAQIAFVHHLPFVGAAKNGYTNGIPVYVYQGSGTPNDGSADGFVDLIHGQYPWQ